MNQPVDTGKHFSKGSKGHQLDNTHLGSVSDRITVGEHRPGIGFGILVAERDLSLLTVKVDDINIQFITDRNNFRRLVNSAPAEFAHMHHAVNAADINKGTVAGQ